MFAHIFLMLLLGVGFHKVNSDDETQTIMIGARLSSEEEFSELEEAVRDLNKNSRLLPNNYVVNVTAIVMDNNPIESALVVCQKLIPKQVFAVISSHTTDLYLSAVSVSYTCGFYNIPVIGISARESIFSDKGIHKSYLRTVPPYSHQAFVWADIIDFFGWKEVVLMTTDDQDGRAITTLLRRTLEDHDMYKFKLEKVIQFKHGETNMTSYLQEAKLCQSTVVILYASERDAATIYQDAHRLNMTREGYAWITTEQGITGEALSMAPEGLIGMRLNGGGNSSAHIRDALKVIAKGYHSFLQTEQGEVDSGPPTHCREDGPWVNGGSFYANLIEATIVRGSVGRIEFDSSGDMLAAEYTLLNYQKNLLFPVGSWSIGPDPIEMYAKASIIWPGGTRIKPAGFEIPTHLRVVTIRSHPFTYVDPMVDGECEPPVNPIVNVLECTTHDGELQCCYGFCMDLLAKLSDELNFTYEVHVVHDNNYGGYERMHQTGRDEASLYEGVRDINGSTKRWTGLIGELKDNRADIIVAPLTINQDRADVIDFSKPFKYQGLTILIKRPLSTSNLLQFLRPFEANLWFLIFASIHLVAILLYLLDRFSPFSRPKHGNQDEPDSCNISQAVWFSWSVMFNSGVGEGTPRSFAARVLGVVWAGFAMIIVASYTANLAAFLVLDKPKGGITGINDARIRNPSSSFQYATVERSSVETYFRRQVELSSMYLFMKDYNFKKAEDAIIALKEDKIQAFIWDSAMLDYEAARDCSLMTVGELFGRSGFGIGLRKDSPWTSKISLKILNFHENGLMEGLDSLWIRQKICLRTNNQPKTLGMANMGGVFILVAGGLVFSCFCIWVEIVYKRNQEAKQRQLDLARVAVAHWRGTVKVRNNIQSKLQMRRGKMNQMSHQSPSGESKQNNSMNGVQGPAALEKEMDGTMPVSLLSRRHRNKVPSARLNNAASHSTMQAKAIYGDIELKERV